MAATTKALTALAARVRPNDPGLAGLRRAARTGLLLPAAFAVTRTETRNPHMSTFVAFGCFSLLAMADFGGPRRTRAAATAATALAGAALVALGTLASATPWTAAAAVLLLGFGVQFAGAFGGYVAAAQPAVLLPFVLAVSVPAPLDAVDDRVDGWLLAGAVATLGSILLWPGFERISQRARGAAACRAAAKLVALQREGHDAAAWRAARKTVDAIGQEHAATLARPTGPTRRERALAKVLVGLQQLVEVASRPPAIGGRPRPPCIEEGRSLTAAVVRTLRASGDALVGGPPPDLRRLEEARRAHREALDRWAAESLRAGLPAADVFDGLNADHRLRALSYLALTVGSDAVIAAVGRPVAGLPLPPGSRALAWMGRTLRVHLQPASSLLHHSVRVAVGLALAVLVARLLRLDHAFWVVLGALSVLRSNALATGRTTIEAIGGTVAGIALGSLYVTAVGNSGPDLWVTLPLTVFLAAYAASAVGFVVGQAAFSLNMLVLFNLISPAGWRIGVARLEDVAVGAGISVVVGLLLWPHGARRELGTAAAALYRALVVYLAGSFDCVLEGGQDDGGRTRRRAVEALERANEAFDRFLDERGAMRLDPRMAAWLLVSAHRCLLVGDLLRLCAGQGYLATGCPAGSVAVRAQVQVALAALLLVADRLEGATGAGEGRVEVSCEAVSEAALDCLRRWREDASGGGAAIAVVVAAEVVAHLGELAADLERAAAAAAASARVPWWR